MKLNFYYSDLFWQLVEIPNVKQANEYWENMSEYPQVKGKLAMTIVPLF
jgi:hypothetical protein